MDTIEGELQLVELLYDTQAGQQVAWRLSRVPDGLRPAQVGSFLTFLYGEPHDVALADDPDRPGEQAVVGWVFAVPPGMAAPIDRDNHELHAIPQVAFGEDVTIPLFVHLDRAQRAGDLPADVDVQVLAGGELWEPNAAGWTEKSRQAAIAGDYLTAGTALDLVAEVAPPATPDERGHQAVRRADLLIETEQPGEALTLLTNLLDEVGDELSVEVAEELHHQRALALSDLGHHDEALAVHLEIRAAAVEAGNDHGVAIADLEVGMILSELGHLEAARERLDRAAEAFVSLLDPENAATALLSLGPVLSRLGETTPAIQALEIAEQEFGIVGARRNQMNARFNLANVRCGTGDVHGAAAAYREAIDAYGEMGVPTQQADAMDALAGTLHAMGQYEDALDWHGRAMQLHVDHGTMTDAATCATSLAHTLTHLECWDEAQEMLEVNLEAVRNHGWDAHVSDALGTLALLHAQHDDSDRAFVLLDELRTHIDATGVHVRQDWIDLVTGTALTTDARPHEALAVLERALEASGRRPLLQVEVHLELARAHEWLGDAAAQRDHLQEAAALLRRYGLHDRAKMVLP